MDFFVLNLSVPSLNSSIHPPIHSLFITKFITSFCLLGEEYSLRIYWEVVSIKTLGLTTRTSELIYKFRTFLKKLPDG